MLLFILVLQLCQMMLDQRVFEPLLSSSSSDSTESRFDDSAGKYYKFIPGPNSPVSMLLYTHVITVLIVTTNYTCARIDSVSFCWWCWSHSNIKWLMFLSLETVTRVQFVTVLLRARWTLAACLAVYFLQTEGRSGDTCRVLRSHRRDNATER